MVLVQYIVKLCLGCVQYIVKLCLGYNRLCTIHCQLTLSSCSVQYIVKLCLGYNRLCTIHCQHCQVAVYNTLSSCALDIIGCVQYIVKLHKSVAKK